MINRELTHDNHAINRDKKKLIDWQPQYIYIRDGPKKSIHLTIAIFLFTILKSIFFFMPESILIHIKYIALF